MKRKFIEVYNIETGEAVHAVNVGQRSDRVIEKVRRGGWASIRLMLDVYAGEDESPDLIEAVFGTFESQSFMGKSHKAPNMKTKSK